VQLTAIETTCTSRPPTSPTLPLATRAVSPRAESVTAVGSMGATRKVRSSRPNSTSTDCSPLRLIAHVPFTQRLVCEVHAVARTRGSSRSGAKRRMSGILANSRGTHSDASTSIPVRKTRIIAADPREPTIRG
jgi:hypothetical protein